jgi:paraquat-inducible protein B
MATIVSGGVSFAPPPRDMSDAAPQNTEFVLARDQETAMAPPEGPAQYIQLRFDQSLRGLSVGAPV